MIQESWATPSRKSLGRGLEGKHGPRRKEQLTNRRVKFVTNVTGHNSNFGDFHSTSLPSIQQENQCWDSKSLVTRNDISKDGSQKGYESVHGGYNGCGGFTTVYNFSRRAMLTTIDRNQVLPNQALLDSELIYKSILATPSEKIEMYTNDGPKPTPCLSRASLTINDEFGSQKLKANRQIASTKIIQVGATGLPVVKKKGRGMNGFFPPVKLRDPSADARRSRSEYLNTPPFMLELAPEEGTFLNEEARVPSAKSVPKSEPSLGSRQYTFTPPVYPFVVSDKHYNDLTLMPKPRMLTSRGELPWVFRQKVKKSMNELSKIMTSKSPPPNADQSSPVAYKYF